MDDSLSGRFTNSRNEKEGDTGDKKKQETMDGSLSGRFTALPDDILVGILSRIPVKTLYKFKSVSQKWLHWISSDLWFKKLKNHQSLSSPLLISYEIKGFNQVSLTTTDLNGGQIIDEFEVSVVSRNANPFIQVTLCKDLICIFSDIEIVVCNPSNRGLIKFENYDQNSPNCVGIGYVAFSNVYKVVALFPEHVHDFLGYKIFTIKENSNADDVFSCVVDTFSFEPFKFYPLDDRLPICVNGIMYWMMKNSRDDHQLRDLAYYLDLDKGHLGTVPCPKLTIEDKILVSYKDMKFVEFHGWLCLQCFQALTSNIVFYALKDVQNGIWEMFYKISIPSVDPRPGIPHVLGVKPGDSGNGEIVIAFNKNGLETIYLYNSRDQGMKEVKISPYQPGGRFRFLYFDCLFSFKNDSYPLPV